MQPQTFQYSLVFIIEFVVPVCTFSDLMRKKRSKVLNIL